MNHSIPEFARWIEETHQLITTNGIESFWSTLKEFLSRHRAVTLRHLYLYVAAAAWHISHQDEPLVDQMRALFRNSHEAWSRPVREKHDTLLSFQLEVQPSSKPAPSSKRMPRAA